MVTRQYKIRPQLDPTQKAIHLGSGDSKGGALWLGTLAEATTGSQPKVWLATAKEQVVAVVGKRGSGKSFTLGVIAEGLGVMEGAVLGRQDAPRAVLLFDPLDVYWTTRYSVQPTGNKEVSRHYQMAKSADLLGLGFNVEAWVPGSQNRRQADPDWFKTLQLPVSAMGLEEWELLLDVNIMTQPIGQALADALVFTRDRGFTSEGEVTDPRTDFDLLHLSRAARSEELAGIYHPETIRALSQRLGALHSTGLFSAEGTRIRELLAPGRVTIVMLGRLPEGYRAAVVAVLTRMLISVRNDTSFAEKRLVLDSTLDDTTRAALTSVVESGIPKTVVMLDEAQSFLAPGPSNSARDLFIRLVKEGRNMGLSAVLATQQPSALDQRVLSQVETFVAHQLVTEPDIRAVKDNLKSSLPDSISSGANKLSLSDLLRQLPPGYCLVSAADMDTTVRRALVVNVRPRATVHGGIEL
ncbi:ATP-binding protein [Wenzhouxiangella sp. XN24]|uniref:ATP-binding protein n=1 Tax=Wenzhouxiangella sp. XN24 TaxID=2713569 RepID=UPI0013E9C360|nr:ATP-binding protein [Wenzhouxiangella sp. XN24]NGX16022.1 ATP-binding protein [Wenzhouxiangella sp. XN24]